MKELTAPARLDQLDRVLEFIGGELEAADCPLKVQTQMAIAAEEIFVNIAHYAYATGEGQATLRLEISGGEPRLISLQFLDSGQPYDPLKRKDPDITLTAEERDIGGLGIFMVKKSMDSMEYQYKDNMNILTITKSF